jgi:hypothetical protein
LAARSSRQNQNENDVKYLIHSEIFSVKSRFSEIGFLLFVNQRPFKNRPRIKAGKIRPPETPAVFIFFFDREVNQ